MDVQTSKHINQREISTVLERLERKHRERLNVSRGKNRMKRMFHGNAAATFLYT